MRAARLLELVAALSLCAPAEVRAEIVYVAIGGSYPFAGAAQPSDAARIADRLRAAGHPVRLVDLTTPGATAREVRESQLPRAIALRPRLVTIALGPADVVNGVRLAPFSRDVFVALDLLRRAGATVVISRLPAAESLREAPSAAFRRRVAAFDWAIRRNARSAHARVAELDAAAATPEGAWAAAVSAALEASLPPARRAPPDRAVEPPPEVGAVQRPPSSLPDERRLASR